MILKVVRGDYFPGLVSYIMRFGHYAEKGDVARVIRCEGLYDPRTAAAQLATQAAKAPTRTKRAVHLIGRAEGTLTDEQYVETAEAGMAVLGLAAEKYLLVVHSDGGFHCATVEIDEHGNAPPRRLWSSSLKKEVTPTEGAALPPGDVVSRSWDGHAGWRLTKLARSLEIRFGLQQIGRNHDSYDKIRTPDWQLRLEGETGLAPLQEVLGDEIKEALDLHTWAERADALAVHGLGLRSYAGSNRKRRGLVIYALGEPKHLCKGSSLGKAYGLGALEERTGETIDCWLARQSLEEAENRLEPQATSPTRTGGEALKSEFDALRDHCLDVRKAEAKVATTHDQRLSKLRTVIALLRERLLATGQVCRSWARLICSRARSELMKKVMHLRDLDRQALPPRERPPSWREFLKSRAATNPVAQALLDALEPRKRTTAATTVGAQETSEVGNTSSDGPARDSSNNHTGTAASAAVPLPTDVVADEDAARQKVLNGLWHRLVGHVRLDGPDDVENLIAVVRKQQPDALDSLLHPSMARECQKLCIDIHRRQIPMIAEVLTYIGKQTEPVLLQPDRIVAAEGTVPKMRGLLDATFHWPEVQQAIRQQVATLSALSHNEGLNRLSDKPEVRPSERNVGEEEPTFAQAPTPNGISLEGGRALKDHDPVSTEVRDEAGEVAATTRQTGTATKSDGVDATRRYGRKEQPSSAAGSRRQIDEPQELPAGDAASSQRGNQLASGLGSGAPVRKRPRGPAHRVLADAVNERRKQFSETATAGAPEGIVAGGPVVDESTPTRSAIGDGMAPVGELAPQFGREPRENGQAVQAIGEGHPTATSATAEPVSSVDIVQTHRPPVIPQPTTPGQVIPKASFGSGGMQAPAGPTLEQSHSNAVPGDERPVEASPKPRLSTGEAPDEERTRPSPTIRDQGRDLLARQKEQGRSTKDVRSRGPSDATPIAAIHIARKGQESGR